MRRSKIFERQRIYVCYPYIAHYREAIFSVLSGSKRYDYVFLADNESMTSSSLRTIKDSDKPEWKWHALKNYFLKVKTHEFLWQPGLVRRVLFDKIDAVILLGDPHYVSNWFVLLICKIKRIPVLNWGIGIMRPEKGLKWIVRSWYLRLFDMHLLYGNWAKNYLLKKGFKAKDFRIVYNSLDYNKMSQIRDSLPLENSARIKSRLTGNESIPLLLHSGRIIKRKKIGFIIDAISKLKAKGFIAHLLIVGDGPELNNLIRYCRTKGISSQVHFFGSCYDEYTLGALMSACDAAVVAGQLGLFSIQSLTYGLPVITHDNRKRISGPESESIINNRTGVIYRQDNLDDLAYAIQNFFDGDFDKKYYRNSCHRMVMEKYNPHFQLSVINGAIEYFIGRTNLVE